MKIKLILNTVPVRARQRKNCPEKRESMEKYVSKLLAIGFVVPTKNPEWVSAPNMVSKKPLAIFYMALDLRPISTATVPILRIMLYKNNEWILAATVGSKKSTTKRIHDIVRRGAAIAYIPRCNQIRGKLSAKSRIMFP